jgi:hypothetical protein
LTGFRWLTASIDKHQIMTLQQESADRAGYRLLITLIAKGSMNNLHRSDIVEAFKKKGVEVRFLVRKDYIDLLTPIEGCRYLTCRFPQETGVKGLLRGVSRYLRSLYPVGAIGRRQTRPPDQRLRMKALNEFSEWLGRKKIVMRLISWGERRLYLQEEIEGLDGSEADQLLLLGVGADGAKHETALTWWARQHGISVVHMIGNWDTLTSKGYPGVPVSMLLVWGPVMKKDAIELHDIPERSIRMIGSIRYDRLHEAIVERKEDFFTRLGLDPAKKTILFAGPLSEDQYFEMMQAYEELLDRDSGYQMIFRMYPGKNFMTSPYAKPIIAYARSLPGVYVSIGDPDYRIGSKEKAVMQIEQFELWHAFEYSDVIINYFSTVALESCVFDRPVISILQRPMQNYGWLSPPVYADHPGLPHNMRLFFYGAVQRVNNRTELLAAIRDAVDHPDKYKEARRRAVAEEMGVLDGHVVERMVDCCKEAMEQFRQSV